MQNRILENEWEADHMEQVSQVKGQLVEQPWKMINFICKKKFWSHWTYPGSIHHLKPARSVSILVHFCKIDDEPFASHKLLVICH